MAEDSRMLAAYILFGVGALIVLIAIIWVTVLCCRRSRAAKRSKSPDTFKVMYRAPTSTANSRTTDHAVLVTPEMVKMEPLPAVHTARTYAQSEGGFATTKSMSNGVVRVGNGVPANGGSMILMNRAASVDRMGRVVQPVLQPVVQSQTLQRQRVTSDSSGRFVVPVPIRQTNTKQRVNKKHAMRGSGMQPQVRGNKVYLYGSVPNLYAGGAGTMTTKRRQVVQQQHIVQQQPKQYYLIPKERRAHVQQWLHTSRPDLMSAGEEERPPSRAGSAPAGDADDTAASMYALHLKWQPGMTQPPTDGLPGDRVMNGPNETLPVYQIRGQYGGPSSYMSTKTM